MWAAYFRIGTCRHNVVVVIKWVPIFMECLFCVGAYYHDVTVCTRQCMSTVYTATSIYDIATPSPKPAQNVIYSFAGKKTCIALKLCMQK